MKFWPSYVCLYYIILECQIIAFLTFYRISFNRSNLNVSLHLDPRNPTSFCFHLFLYKYFVFNSKLVYMCLSIFKT